MTTAGSGVKGFDGFFKYADEISPLNNDKSIICYKNLIRETNTDDCANYCVSQEEMVYRKGFFGFNSSMVTMQNLFHDGGFSNTGVSEKVMEFRLKISQ